MKHLSVLFTFCFALVSLVATAAPPPVTTGNVLLKTRSLEKQAFSITLANLEQQETKVTLKTLDGRRVFLKETIRKHNGFSLRVDMASLGDGKYLLEVDQEDESLHQVIVIEDGKLLFSKITA